MATRPKQRVLVRWNDDLDKSLLLFITHTCTELGIKIPYDEVARRMGSTFTEGAIQQHISKLRNKMADLNTAPVPPAPKRGAVTNKPSSVYGQKSRAGLAPQQPVLSRPSTRTTYQTTLNTYGGKRPSNRTTTGIKRSESDDNETDEEFGGESDDEFVAESGTQGKRKRNTGRNQLGRVPKRINNLDAQRLSEYEKEQMNLGETDVAFHARLAQAQAAAAHEMNNNSGRVQNSIETDHGQNPYASMPTLLGSPFHVNQNGQWSPNPVTPMPAHTEGFGPDGHQIGHQAIHPSFVSQNGGIGTYNQIPNFNNFSMGSHGGQSFETAAGNGHMPAPVYPSVASMPSPFSQIATPQRNDSLASASSQNTMVGAITPLQSSGTVSQYPTPANDCSNVNHANMFDGLESLTGWDFDTPDITSHTNNEFPGFGF